MEINCKSCKYNVIENDNMICDFPLIDEMFLDGFNENPTNTSNDGVNCKRYASKETS